MAKLILTNQTICDIKEDAEDITRKIWAARGDIQLTLILNPLSSDRREVKARFMIAAIAYWY